jgi:hypothetical protein
LNLPQGKIALAANYHLEQQTQTTTKPTRTSANPVKTFSKQVWEANELAPD